MKIINVDDYTGFDISEADKKIMERIVNKLRVPGFNDFLSFTQNCFDGKDYCVDEDAYIILKRYLFDEEAHEYEDLVI